MRRGGPPCGGRSVVMPERPVSREIRSARSASRLLVEGWWPWPRWPVVVLRVAAVAVLDGRRRERRQRGGGACWGSAGTRASVPYLDAGSGEGRGRAREGVRHLRRGVGIGRRLGKIDERRLSRLGWLGLLRHGCCLVAGCWLLGRDNRLLARCRVRQSGVSQASVGRQSGGDASCARARRTARERPAPMAALRLKGETGCAGRVIGWLLAVVQDFISPSFWRWMRCVVGEERNLERRSALDAPKMGGQMLSGAMT